MKKRCLLIGIAVLSVVLSACSSWRPTHSTESDNSQSKFPAESSTKSSSAGSIVLSDKTAEADGLKLTVTSVTKNEGQQFTVPSQGKVFLVVHVRVQNEGEKKVEVGDILFKLDLDGVEQDSDVLGERLDGVTPLDYVTLKNGSALEGDLIFQVSKDYSGGAVLEYFDNAFAGEPIMKITL